MVVLAVVVVVGVKCVFIVVAVVVAVVVTVVIAVAAPVVVAVVAAPGRRTARVKPLFTIAGIRA